MPEEQSASRKERPSREELLAWKAAHWDGPFNEAKDRLCDALLAAPLSERGSCPWTPDDDGVYHTGCKEAFTFIDSGPKENNMKFCCYCGGTMDERQFERSE